MARGRALRGKALRGMIRVRRLIRRMPAAVRGELVVELAVTGRRIADAVRARTPRKTGRLIRGISSNVLPGTLRLQVGLLAKGRGSRNDRFYGRIQDLGRKAQVVRVTRGRGKSKPYQMRVRAMAGKRFVTGRYPELRRELSDNLKGIMGRALARIAGGADE